MPANRTTSTGATTSPSRARVDLLVAAVAVVVSASAGLVFFTAVGSARGRISATTESEASVFSAARIEIDLDIPSELRFDADALYPGLVVERCLRVSLTGSIDGADLRLLGRSSGGDGLEQFIDTTVSVGEGDDPECSDYVPTRTLFDDRLATLWEDHRDFASGLVIDDSVPRDFQATVRITATVVDDNRAQGLDTDFRLTFEARP